jgi:Protein of unknown function (DUF2752)
MEGRLELDPHDLRVAGGLMLALGATLPLLPGHPGLPCPLRTLTGIPCPLCGMSTSVEETVRLDLGDALAANPAGIVVVALALLFLFRRPARLHIPIPLAGLSLAAMWLFELHRFSIL